MKTWSPKQLSQLVDVSVRTLHHYDKIGLLTPSIRGENNYRYYSEKDLLTLQQVIALKFFGFSLAQINAILQGEQPLEQQLSIQTDMLHKKVAMLQNAQEILSQVVNDVAGNQSISWQKTIKMIEVYKMTEQLEHSWVKEIFNQQELKQYAEFEHNLKHGPSAKDEATFKKEWEQLIKEVNNNLDKEPSSSIGIEIGGKMMTWVNQVYGKKYAHLRTKKMEQGFGEGLGLDDVGFTKESVKWVEEAMDAYWRDRILSILNQIGDSVPNHTEADWQCLLDDMYGDDNDRKSELLDKVLAEPEINAQAKTWLKSR